jgi:hypothetical protein
VPDDRGAIPDRSEEVILFKPFSEWNLTKGGEFIGWLTDY